LVAGLLVLLLLTSVLVWGRELMRSPQSEAASAAAPELRKVECWFAIPEDRDLECAYMQLGAERGGFSLPVVVLRDHSPDHRPDPLVYLTGGPGSSSFLDSQSIDHWFYWADIAALSPDIVLVDQRGTGLSKPQFRCPLWEQYLRNTLRENLSLREEHIAGLAAVEQCVALLEAAGFALSDFSTSESARDMNQILLALGYEQWNVMGGSYGTRLALDWLRQDGHRIRSVVLDSVYPLDKGSLNEWPALLDESFDYFWRTCGEKGACGNAAGADLEARFWATLDRLSQQPITLSVPLWEGGWPLKVVLNDHRFLGMTYTALYDNNLQDDIVRAMDEVLDQDELGGETEALQKLAENAINSELAPEFNVLVYLAVDCAESAPVSREDFEAVRERYPRWADYSRYAWQYDMCKAIPQRSDLADFRRPVRSEVPALILSGGFDPVTPARWAREVAARLDNSQHWHLPSVGHGVVSSSACVHEAFREFLDAPLREHPLPCQ